MIRPWHILVFVLALAAFVAARAPVSLVIHPVPGAFAYAKSSGTIWDATFEGSEIAGLPAGEVRVRTRAADLVRGAAVADVAAAGPAVAGAGTLELGLFGRRRLQARTLTIQGLPLFRGLALEGETRLENIDIVFDGGRCVSASGAARSDALARNDKLLRWRGPELRGGARCVGDVAEIGMAGAADDGRFEIVVSLRADGAGEWRAGAASTKPGVIAVLALAGMRPGTAGLEIRRDIKWFPF